MSHNSSALQQSLASWKRHEEMVEAFEQAWFDGTQRLLEDFLPANALDRAAVLIELGKDYVAASRMAGAGRARLMFLTVLPNCLAPLIVQASLGFSTAILDTAALGFLGLGAQPPTPEWGTMLADSREFIRSDPWIVTLPGLAILITVVAINLTGDGLRDALDPKMRRS